MVKLKFIIRGGVLVLRVSQLKVRFYKRVESLLKDAPNLKYWSSEKERFTSYAASYAENNQILADFKDMYWRVIVAHPELTADQVAHFYKTVEHPTALHDIIQWPASEYANSVSKYLQVIICRERAKQGCNNEIYEKLLSRCRKSIPAFENLAFTMLDFNRMITIAYTLSKEPSYVHMTKAFRALLSKASKDRSVSFDISQIGDFCFNDYNPRKYAPKIKRPDVLTAEQIKRFMNFDSKNLSFKEFSAEAGELFYDFCVFMFHSFFSPCDIIKARLADVTKNDTIIAQRKKTHKYVEVPITPIMREIINKYRGSSKYGYIFPIMDDEKEARSKTKDYCFKHFRTRLNAWLKPIGEILGTDFQLYAYVFRHTAITVAINSGLPILYVANVAGTSVEMIQKHYFNGENEHNRDALTNVLMNAGI